MRMSVSGEEWAENRRSMGMVGSGGSACSCAGAAVGCSSTLYQQPLDSVSGDERQQYGSSINGSFNKPGSISMFLLVTTNCPDSFLGGLPALAGPSHPHTPCPSSSYSLHSVHLCSRSPECSPGWERSTPPSSPAHPADAAPPACRRELRLTSQVPSSMKAPRLALLVALVLAMQVQAIHCS